MKSVAERVGDDLVGHNPFVPRAGETKSAFGASDGFE
jgi:hypothetical protein